MPEPSLVQKALYDVPDGNENEIYSTSTAGYYMFNVEWEEMLSGDVTTVRLYKKLDSARDWKKVEEHTHDGAGVGVAYHSPGLECLYGFRVTIQQTAGTLRDYYYLITKT